MDTRISNAVAPLPSSQTRTDIAATRGAVTTDMAPPVAITAQAGAEQNRWNRDRRGDGPGQVRRQFENSLDLDRETGDLIYRIIDPSSRAVIAQYPYEGLLKLRAYIKSTNSRG